MILVGSISPRVPVYGDPGTRANWSRHSRRETI